MGQVSGQVNGQVMPFSNNKREKVRREEMVGPGVRVEKFCLFGLSR